MGLRLPTLRDDAPAGLPPLSRWHVPGRATRHHPRARRPRRAPAAHRRGVGRRRHRPTGARRPGAHRHRGGAAPVHRRAPRRSGRLPRARPGAPRPAGPGRRAGALAARPRRPAAGRRRSDEDAGRLLLQTRLPDHEVVQAVRQGDPMRVVAAETPRRQALGFPPFGGLAEVRGGAEAVAAACAAVRRGRRDGPRARCRGHRARCSRAPSVDLLCDALARHRGSTPPGPRGACASTSTLAGCDMQRLASGPEIASG